eukprot:TRINITY_DN3565_c0_g1_i3.p1 TRINITY_DN3565_c0_g1~~TRINITY_DN3565_c0_g1_i3.p1  ORF type:complete len:272 (-),score=20.61 TRINITY_DN3565_c0_g1_i3:70-885(-)
MAESTEPVKKHPYTWSRSAQVKVPVTIQLPGRVSTPVAPATPGKLAVAPILQKNAVLPKTPNQTKANAPKPAEPKNAQEQTNNNNNGNSKPGECLIINEKQRSNPVVKYITQVRYDWTSQITTDFLPCEDAGILFLSLRYHLCQPAYIGVRVQAQGNKFKNNILLCLVDTPDHRNPLRELNVFAIKKGLTLIVCWSNKEAARYIETYRAYTNKPFDSIKSPATTDFFSQYTDTITSIRSVNSTDAMTLLKNFGSLKNIMNATHEQLILCPG